MTHSKDLTGQRFGRLTVIALTDERNNSRAILWECRCDCGNTKLVTSGNLLSGNTRSCGCFRKERMKLKLKDLAGQRFGRLTVVRRVDKFWECRCDCGEVTYVVSGSLVSGRTKSCGCLRQEVSKNRGVYKVKTREAEIKRWQLANPGGSKKKCHIETGIGLPTIRKWWSS